MANPYAQYVMPSGGNPYAQYAPQGGGVQDWEPQSYSGEQKAARVVGVGAQGFNDAVAGTVGAPVDAAAWALRQAGIPANNPIGGSASIKKGMDYVATLPGRVGDAVSQRSLGPLADDRTSRLEPINQTEKISQGVGEGVGNALSVALPAAAIARGAQAGTVGQGVANTLATQPVMQTIAGAAGGGVAGATDNPWLGLGASVAVPVAASVGRRAVTPVINQLTPQEQRLVAAAEREGIPLTAAQRTGSPALTQIEGTMAKIPGASGPMERTLDNQRQQFNRATLERAGVTATDAAPTTIERAFVNAGQTFDDLAARTVVRPDAQFAHDVTQVEANYGRRLPTDVRPVFTSYMDDLAPVLQAVNTGTNPQIAGDVYTAIRSDLARRIRESQSNPPLQRALGGLVEALDSAMERSTSGALRGEWQEARRQYQALMTIDKAMQGGSQVDRAAGNIPLGALKNATMQSDRAGYARGRGQMNEMSRVGDFIGSRVPDSGTGTRNAVSNPLMWPVMAVGNVAARAYNSGPGQAYLTNQLAGQTNFNALYGGIAGQQGLEEARGGRNALSRRGER